MKGFAPARRLITKKWKFWIFGAAFPPPAPIEVTFCTASGPRCPSTRPCLTWIGITSRPCGAKSLIFDLWVDLIPAACASRHPAGKINLNNNTLICENTLWHLITLSVHDDCIRDSVNAHAMHSQESFGSFINLCSISKQNYNRIQ